MPQSQYVGMDGQLKWSNRIPQEKPPSQKYKVGCLGRMGSWMMGIGVVLMMTELGIPPDQQRLWLEIATRKVDELAVDFQSKSGL
jgi:hypothetical protein